MNHDLKHATLRAVSELLEAAINPQAALFVVDAEQRVVELGPKGSGYALDCFPDAWKDAIVARGEIENEFEKALRRAKK